MATLGYSGRFSEAAEVYERDLNMETLLVYRKVDSSAEWKQVFLTIAH